MPSSESSPRNAPFEFRHRAMLMMLVYIVGFGWSVFDHRRAAFWAAQQLSKFPALAGSFSTFQLMKALLLAGAVFTAAAAALRSWGAAYLRREVVFDPNLRSERIVADGPYRYVRNPLYLGDLLLAAGIGALASPWGWVILLGGNLTLHYRLISLEEPRLLMDQGDRFRAYRLAVPRLRPALRPRLPASGAKPEWPQALRGELFIWVLALAVLCAALTRLPRLTYALIDLALAIFVIDRIKNRLAGGV